MAAVPVPIEAPPHWQAPAGGPKDLTLPQRAAMDGQQPGGSSTHTQRVFSAALGPSRLLSPLPRLSGSASDRAVTSREREEVAFKVETGKPLEYQGVPCTGSLVGVNYVPPRRPPLRQPRSGASAATAAPPPPHQPANATLWALVQPADHVGVLSSLSVVDAGLTGFGGWHQSGFLDLSRRVGLDWVLEAHPAGGVSTELELGATTPRLLRLLPELTARHRMVGGQRGKRVQHSTSLSMPLGPAQARAQLREPGTDSPLAPSEGSTFTLELLPRSKRSRGLAGGAKLQPGCATAFHGDRAAAAGSGSKSGSSGSDSDDEGGSSGGADKQRQRSSLPGLRLEMVPGAASSWEDVSSSWRQSWGSRLSSSVAYQARQRRWNMQLSQKLSRWLTAAGTLACDAPAVAGEAAGEGAAAAAAEEAGSGLLHQLSSHVRSYAAGSSMRRAGLKLRCRLGQPARVLRLETSYSAPAAEGSGGGGGGLAHTLGYRFGRRTDYRRERAWCDLELRAGPAPRQLAVSFEVFSPL